jgi:hypothetical protein
MSRLFSVAIFLFAILIIVKLWPRILGALRRFDAANVARHEGEIRDRQDQLAHFRHTISVASEQVDDIGEIETRDIRTGNAVVLYTFAGEHYATRMEAEKARAQKIGDIARGFYRELPAALAHRSKDRLH